MAENFKIRPATWDDAKNIFDLSNDDVVRANSIRRERIEWASHLKWFASALDNPDCAYFAAECDGEFCGQIRFNRDGDDWVVSISVVGSFRGKRIGSRMLNSAIQKMLPKSVAAYVKSGNEASLKMFSACGFRECSEKTIDGEIYKFLRYAK